MTQTSVHERDLKWVAPARILIAGASLSGKTSLLISIIKCRAELFDCHFSRVIFVSNPHMRLPIDVEEKLKDAAPMIELVNDGVPEVEQMKSPEGEHSLVCFDDLFVQLAERKQTLDLFSHFSHHHLLTVIQTSQASIIVEARPTPTFFFTSARALRDAAALATSQN